MPEEQRDLPPQPAGLSPEEAAQIRKASIENLRAKVAKGGTLTEAELRQLRDAEANYQRAVSGEPVELPMWVKGQDALAEALGYKNRKTIQRLLKMEGCPGEGPEGTYDVNAWKAWQKKEGRSRANEIPDKATAEVAGILIKNQRNRIELEQAQGSMVTIEEVISVLCQMANAAATRLTASRHTLGPEVVGVSVPEATKRIGVEHHAVLTELSTVPTWAKKKPHPAGLFWQRLSLGLSDHLQIAVPGAGQSSTS